MKRLVLFSFFVLSYTLSIFAQSHSIIGTVVDNNTLKPISGVNVIVKHNTDNIIITYTTTDDNGTFSLHISHDNLTDYTLQVTCLGYEQQTLNLTKNNYSIKLKEKSFDLQEVTVKADKIIQNKDTTSYYVAGFATIKDRSIGDVLTNMPGINVAENGKISYNGSPINKFYVEGIDLFDGKYSLATNNISYENIARVEVIENHQAIKALQGTGVDTETAINLKLKDSAKSVWNGNLLGKGGFTPDGGLWETELFAARFSSKSQSATTLKSNNSGKNIADEGNALTIDDLLYMYPDSKISANLTSEPSIPTNLSDDRTRFNRTHIFSNSSMWKLSESAQIKSQIIYIDDKDTYNQSIESSYYLMDSLLIKETKETSSVKDKGLQASVIATIDKDSYFFSDKLSFTSNWKTFTSGINGDFNYHSMADINTYNVENKLKYVKKTDKNIFQIMSLNKYEFIPEDLYVGGESVKQQKIDKGNFFSNTNFRFLHNIKRWSLGTNIDLFGNIYNFNSLYNDSSTNYQNDLNVNYIGARLNPEIIRQNENLKLNLKFPLSVYHFNGKQSATKIYVKPEVYLKWKFLPRWTLFANAAFGNSYAGNGLYYTAPIMTDYRSMYAGFLNYDGKIEKRIGGRISYAIPSNMLFANLSVTYSDENTKKSISKQVDNGYVYYLYEPSNDKYKLLFANGSISKGIELIKGSIELSSSFQNHNMPMKQNGYISTINFGSINSGISLKSNPCDWFNIDYKIEHKYNYMKSEALKPETQQLTQKCLLVFYPTEDISIKLNGEHYLTFFDSKQKKNTLLADLEFVYRYKQFDFLASVTNLFNQNVYSYTIYSDLSSITTQYNMRGRNVMIGTNWYF